MYSDIVSNLVSTEDKIREEISYIPCPRREELMYIRTIKNFIMEHKEVLDYIYEKRFKEFGHITKEDFYNFAYTQTSIDEGSSRVYRK
jgi:hypothetical protein